MPEELTVIPVQARPSVCLTCGAPLFLLMLRSVTLRLDVRAVHGITEQWQDEHIVGYGPVAVYPPHQCGEVRSG